MHLAAPRHRLESRVGAPAPHTVAQAWSFRRSVRPPSIACRPRSAHGSFGLLSHASTGWAIHPGSHDYLALLERHRGKDYLGIYELDNMSLVRVRRPGTGKSASDPHVRLFAPLTPRRLGQMRDLPHTQHFAIATSDVQNLSWSPCGRYLAAWESCLDVSGHQSCCLDSRLRRISPG